jgi:TIR domain
MLAAQEHDAERPDCPRNPSVVPSSRRPPTKSYALDVPTSRSARLNIVDRVLAAFDGRQTGTAWSESRINMVLNGFGIGEVFLDPLDPQYDDDFFDRVRRRLQDADDETLVEISNYLHLPSAPDGQAVDASGLWGVGLVRVFLSHSAKHKGLVAEVAEALRIHGLHGFVAHDSIEVSREWQTEIERALRTAEVFVGLIHPEFVESSWTNQEVGWAYGRGLPSFMIRLGADPRGFPGKNQWPSMTAETPQAVAGRIAQWVNSLEPFSHTIGGRLISALSEARSYNDAGRAASALNGLDALTASQWAELDQVYLDNNQVHGGALALRGLKPLYSRHNRNFPEMPPAT